MVSIKINPHESFVEKAVALIEGKASGYFNGIDEIVVEQENKGHLGRVESQSPDKIYIGIGAINSALGNEDDERKVLEIALTLAHEVGHIRSNFTGGEGPAEAEEQRMLSILGVTASDLVRAKRYVRGFIANAQSNEELIANAIITSVIGFSKKVKPENQLEYVKNIKRKILSLDPASLSQKDLSPGAGHGASISLTKNLLNGQDLRTISRVFQLIGANL